MFCMHTHTVYLDKRAPKISTSHCVLYSASPRKVTFATDSMAHCSLDIIQWFLHTNDTMLLHGCTQWLFQCQTFTEILCSLLVPATLQFLLLAHSFQQSFPAHCKDLLDVPKCLLASFTNTHRSPYSIPSSPVQYSSQDWINPTLGWLEPFSRLTILSY